MSAYFDRNKDEYIDRLFHVSTDGAWTDWIAFACEASSNRQRTPYGAVTISYRYIASTTTA